MLVWQLFGWVVLSCGLLSFIEHQVHARMMHNKNFLSSRTAAFKKIYESHAIKHHHHYSKTFTDEPVPPGEDEEIRLTVFKGPFKVWPLVLLIGLISWQGAIIFVCMTWFHHWAWNKIHLEMHKPEDRGFSHWPIYRFLAEYHWMHHKHPNKNFNVVFPFADYLLGTHARPTAEEAVLMKALGPMHGAKSEVEVLSPVDLPRAS